MTNDELLTAFIARARATHGDKYRYDKVVYTKASIPVCITCPEHGDFMQRPDVHVKGCGCPACKGLKRMDKEEFVRRANEIHNNKYDYSHVDFKGTKTKVEIICPEHGPFSQLPKNHLKGQGCPCCGKHYAQVWSKGNWEAFVKSSKKKFGNKYTFPHIQQEYENKYSVITIVCNDCGSIFTKTATDHLTLPNGGCAKCLKDARTEYFTFDDLDKIGTSNGVHVNYFEGQVTKNDKIACTCSIHGEYEVKVGTILEGRGKCKKCSGFKKTSPFDEIKERVLKICGDCLEVVNWDEYQNTTSNLTLRCTTCGHVFPRKINNILYGNFRNLCPQCAKDEISKEQRKTTEQFIQDAIAVHGDKYDYSECEYITSNQKVKVHCNECGRDFMIEANSHLQGKGCPYHNCNSSLMEKELAKYIQTLTSNPVQTNDRTVLNGHELDVVLPAEHLAFEFDGLYWHNELNKEKKYHLSKTIKCQEAGYGLFHIFEDEWLNKKDIVCSMIKNIMGKTERTIQARKCFIQEVSSPDCKVFLTSNHLQGPCPTTYRYGLYYEGELVALMAFGKSRHFIGNGEYEYELLRFCNKLDTHVVGGAGKLFKHFVRKHQPKSIISYADKRWSIGNLYKQLGFIHLRDSSPNYFYVIGNERKNRFNYRKSILVAKYGCPETVSEKDFCRKQKWYRIYDCGTMVFGIHFD